VLNVAAECERKRTEADIEYFALPLQDTVDEDVTQHFNPAFDFIGVDKRRPTQPCVVTGRG
jgi:hypothetical protein